MVSNHTVYSETECSMRCALNSTCLGFNYRTKSNRYIVNCQLSNKSQKGENGKYGEAEKWTFYQDVSKTVYDTSDLIESFLLKSNSNFILFIMLINDKFTCM